MEFFKFKKIFISGYQAVSLTGSQCAQYRQVVFIPVTHQLCFQVPRFGQFGEGNPDAG